MATGKPNAEVARTLVIAISTVKTHTNTILGKLQVTSRTQAIGLARDLHLLSPPAFSSPITKNPPTRP